MGTNCAPLLADIFLYSFQAEFSLCSQRERSNISVQSHLQVHQWSINNPELYNYLGQLYPVELEIKNNTECITSVSHIDLLLSIGKNVQLHTSIYDKQDDFNFYITNFKSNSYSIVVGLWCFYLSAYTPGLATHMNVLFWGPDDFKVSYSNRAWNRHSGSFMIDTGILFSNM